MAPVTILILAAGASTRMAPRDKLTELVEGQPLLRRTVDRALATGAPVTVVLPPDAAARRACMKGLACQIITAADAALGMSASLRAGLAALPPNCPGVMVLPADMPDLTTADLALMLQHFARDPGRIWRGASPDGRPGHPVLFPADLLAALAALSGDEGGRTVVRAQRDRVSQIALPGTHALLDLDTPSDWAAFRARPPDVP
ncbi:MAG: nucleotidyltransferase family protein [Paracoccaceae bacterium]